jgi:hypothetical protein
MLRCIVLFDPIRVRFSFTKNDCSTLCFYRDQSFESGKPMGNYGAFHMGAILDCNLVGLHQEIAPALPKAVDWIEYGLAHDEPSWFGPTPSLHRRHLHEAHGLGLWLRDAVNAPAAWDAAREADAADRTEQTYSQKELKSRYLDDHLAYCFQAERYEEGIAEYEALLGAKKLSMKRSMPPRDIGYALCLHKARGLFEPDELLAAGRRMLAAHLQETWLGYGQANRAAMWLKIVHGHHDPGLTPLQVILKAYEDMPQVARPDFV